MRPPRTAQRLQPCGPASGKRWLADHSRAESSMRPMCRRTIHVMPASHESRSLPVRPWRPAHTPRHSVASNPLLLDGVSRACGQRRNAEVTAHAVAVFNLRRDSNPRPSATRSGGPPGRVLSHRPTCGPTLGVRARSRPLERPLDSGVIARGSAVPETAIFR